MTFSFTHSTLFFIYSGSGFGSLRNDNDANCTYEGDNNVLMQQSSNWLLSLHKKIKVPFKSPLGSVAFLYEKKTFRPPTSVEQICRIDGEQTLVTLILF